MSDDCCNSSVLMVHLPTQSPMGPALQRGERAGPCPGQKGCGQPQRSDISHICMQLGIPPILGHPSQAAPCLTLYGHCLGTDRTAAASGAKVRAQWEPVRAQWEPSAWGCSYYLPKCGSPSGPSHSVQWTAETPPEGKVTWDCFTWHWGQEQHPPSNGTKHTNKPSTTI